MNIGSAYLPLETLSSIARCLEVRDVMSSRLVCKAFNYAASPFLIEEAWISSDCRDWERLTAISKHEVFSKYVHTITYYASVYDSDLLDPNQYIAALGTTNYIREPGKRAASKFQYSKAAVLRGYRQFKEYYKTQQAAYA